MKAEADYQRERKRKRAEESEDGHAEEWKVDPDTPVVLLGAFLVDLSQKAENDAANESAFHVGARVQCDDELLKWEGEARAKQVAGLIEQSTLWHSRSYVCTLFLTREKYLRS